LIWVFFHRLGVEDLSIMLTNIEILAVMLGKDNLLFIVSELQIRHILVSLWGWVVRMTAFLLLLKGFLILFDLLGTLLRFACKISPVDLAAEDSSL
jgi:hypothetical protein